MEVRKMAGWEAASIDWLKLEEGCLSSLLQVHASPWLFIFELKYRYVGLGRQMVIAVVTLML